MARKIAVFYSQAQRGMAQSVGVTVPRQAGCLADASEAELGWRACRRTTSARTNGQTWQPRQAKGRGRISGRVRRENDPSADRGSREASPRVEDCFAIGPCWDESPLNPPRSRRGKCAALVPSWGGLCRVGHLTLASFPSPQPVPPRSLRWHRYAGTPRHFGHSCGVGRGGLGAAGLS
jgi:hypothetical protein